MSLELYTCIVLLNMCITLQTIYIASTVSTSHLVIWPIYQQFPMPAVMFSNHCITLLLVKPDIQGLVMHVEEYLWVNNKIIGVAWESVICNAYLPPWKTCLKCIFSQTSLCYVISLQYVLCYCVTCHSPSNTSDDVTHYQESFMEVMDQIEDWSYIVINNNDNH